MKFNDKTKEIFISQYDYGIPIVFTAKSGFADGDKIIFTFDNENILNKEYTVELVDNTFTFSLAFTQAEAETILNAKLDSCFTIRYSVKHKRGDEFVDSLINSKVVVNSSVPIIHKRNYLVELENENRALKNTLANIADDIAASYAAANERGATLPEVQDSSNLPQTIRSIPISDAAVAFFDYDGTVTHAFPETFVNSMQELPDPPTHSGLRFLGWNWTVEEIKSAVAQFPGKCVNVGALYTTTDGKTRIYIQLDEGETDFTLNVFQTQPDIVSVDWGDGSQLETLSDEITEPTVERKIYGKTHTYEPAEYPATYIVTLTLVSENETYGFGGNYGLSDNSTGSAVRRIEIGSNLSFYKNAFVSLSKMKSIAWGAGVIYRDMFAFDTSLKHLTIGGGVNEYGAHNCYALESVSAPPNCKLQQFGAFYGCHSLKTAGVFPNCTRVPEAAFVECYRLTNIGFPNCTDIGYDAFSQCMSMSDFIPAETIGSRAYANNHERQTITIPNTVRQIRSRAFDDQKVLKEIDLTDFTDPTALPYLPDDFPFTTSVPIYVANETMKTAFSSATNWSTGADDYVVKEN